MFGKNKISDKDLLKTVNRRLDRTGNGSRITASVRAQAVTLTGKLQYENQRIPIVKAAQSVADVRQVIDQLQAPPRTKKYIRTS